MNTVSTNIRFPKDDYEEVKALAYAESKSIAKVIREAVVWYRKQKFSLRKRVLLAEKLKRISVKIDVPVIDLVKEGRKFG